jgi:ATP-dependent protease ClpP protease subunit
MKIRHKIPPQSERTRSVFALLAETGEARAPGIQLKATDAGEEILVYDVIDPFWGASSAAFAEALGKVKGSSVTVRVNSPGGDVFEGRAMANQLRSFRGQTRVIVDGLAASAASTLAIAAQRTEMAAGSFMMVHRSWAFAVGNAADLTDLSALLAKIDQSIAADYAAKADVSAEEALAWMEAETWFSASEAVDAGLADASIDIKAQLRAFNLSAFRNAPAALAAPTTVAQNDATDTDMTARWTDNVRRARLIG